MKTLAILFFCSVAHADGLGGSATPVLAANATNSANATNVTTAQGTFTVVGNAFSIGTSTFVVSQGSVSIGASAVSSAYTLNVQGRGKFRDALDALGPVTVISSISVTAGGVSPGAVFSPALSSNTTSGALSGTFTQTTQIACISGSTITLTLPAGSSGGIIVGFNGAISNGNLAAAIVAGVLVDGAFVNGETAAKGLTAVMEPVTTDDNNLSFSVPVFGLAAGIHNICLSPFTSAGTATIDSTTSTAKLWAYMLP